MNNRCYTPRICQHNLSSHSLYQIWSSMKNRCKSKKSSGEYYEKRGIKVCKEWNMSFLSFYNWAIENGYKKGLTLDRINNNGNYSPKNCRFTTWSIQNSNRRLPKRLPRDYYNYI